METQERLVAPSGWCTPDDFQQWKKPINQDVATRFMLRGLLVSTVRIGIGLVDMVNGVPELIKVIFFETAITDSHGCHPVQRYDTVEEAVIGHRTWQKRAINLTWLIRMPLHYTIRENMATWQIGTDWEKEVIVVVDRVKERGSN